MRTGGRQRLGMLLRCMARTDKVDFAAGLAVPEAGAESYEVPDWLQELGRWRVVASQPRPRWHRFLMALSPRPYLPSWYRIQQLGQLAQEWIVTRQYDIIVVEHSYAIPAALRIKRCPITVVLQDLEANRFRSLAMTRRGIRRAAGMLEAFKMVRLERRCLAHCDGAVTLTRDDERWLRQTGFPGVVATIPNGADLKAFENIPPASQGVDVIFCASLGYAPNVFAAKFLASLWPSVRQQCPEATLLLVGRAPSADVAALDAPMAGIRVIADVPDVAPYYARAGVAAVPIFHGGGAALKLMEAFAAGRPVVATSLATDAYGLSAAPFINRATSPQQFVNEIVRLLQDPKGREATGEQAAAYARNHTWNAAATELRRFLLDVAQSK
jgi:glycosyltransferase involved in cell wall biosynthesis